MNKSTLTTALSLLLASAVCSAQSFEPPKELGKFAVMLGNWEGTGTAMMSPEGPEGQWTSRSTVKKIMDGHFIQEDVRIDLGPQVPVPLVFRSIYAFDSGTKRVKYFSMGNMGFDGAGTAYWTDDGKFVMSSSKMQEGAPVTNHWVVTFSKDKHTFKGQQSYAGGAFYTHVQGTNKKGGKGFSADDSGGLALIPRSAETQKLKVFMGQWKFKGKMSPLPGAPSMSISGNDEIKFILGGQALFGVAKGDPIEGFPKSYRGNWYMVWDAERKCYRSFSVENFGQFHGQRAYFHGDRKLIFVGTAMYEGQPTVGRMMMGWSADGKSMELVQHRLMGDSKPDVGFQGEYKKLD